MFKCGMCKKSSKPREMATVKVVEKRVKEYVQKDEYGNPGKESQGWEIVKEIKVCQSCASKEIE